MFLRTLTCNNIEKCYSSISTLKLIEHLIILIAQHVNLLYSSCSIFNQRIQTAPYSLSAIAQCVARPTLNTISSHLSSIFFDLGGGSIRRQFFKTQVQPIKGINFLPNASFSGIGENANSCFSDRRNKSPAFGLAHKTK